MRNAFVVLVSLYIGVASRFIGPSTVSENNTLSSVPPNFKDENMTLKVNSTTVDHGGELPNNRTNIDENALYEHAADKQNNQSERAFIYINQKYKKPSSIHNYFRVASRIPEYLVRNQHLKPQAIVLQRRNEPCKSEPAHVNSYFQGYDFPDTSQDISSYFGTSSFFNCNNEPLNYNYRGNIQRFENYNAYNKLTTQQRDYIELLKSPLLRPLQRGSQRYDGMPSSHYSPVSYNDFVKLERANKQHNTKANILVDGRKNEPRRNYGFNSAYNPPTIYQRKEGAHRVDEPHFEGDFVNDGESSQIASIEKTQDEDKLLDQYLKDTLEDQVTSKEKQVVPNDCTYRDCIIQPTKTSSSAGLQIPAKNPDCKCGLQSQENEATINRETQEREDYKRNQTKLIYRLAKPEISYYDAVLNDNSIIKRSQELITELNNTLYH